MCAEDPSNPATQDIFWNFEDVALFFLSLSLLQVGLRLAVHFRFLPQDSFVRPQPTLIFFVLLFLTTALFGILKIRYGKSVWRSLGWRVPSRPYVLLAAGIGLLLGLGANLPAYPQRVAAGENAVWCSMFLSTTLGPFLEESFVRGCLLPLLQRSAGLVLSISVTAWLFAVLHHPRSTKEWVWLLTTGVAYGWLRTASRTTTAGAIAHVTYNLVRWLCWRF
jgi:membrane protease YdiL (CAAX protease family)